MSTVIQICGYMRSGTSMCRRLLHSHPDIYITNELGRNVYPEFVKFLSSADRMFSGMPTSVMRRRWQQKKLELVRDMWLGLSKFDEDPSLARQAGFIGNKTPRAELHHRELDSAAAPARVLYVYCLRAPEKVLRSKINMHLSNRDFLHGFRDLEKSIATMLEMRSRSPERLFLFSVDAYGRNPERVTRELLDFIGADARAATVRKMVDQPPANQMSQQIRSRIAAGEKVGGVEELSADQIGQIRESATFRTAADLLAGLVA